MAAAWSRTSAASAAASRARSVAVLEIPLALVDAGLGQNGVRPGQQACGGRSRGGCSPPGPHSRPRPAGPPPASRRYVLMAVARRSRASASVSARSPLGFGVRGLDTGGVGHGPEPRLFGSLRTGARREAPARPPAVPRAPTSSRRRRGPAVTAVVAVSAARRMAASRRDPTHAQRDDRCRRAATRRPPPSVASDATSDGRRSEATCGSSQDGSCGEPALLPARG